MKLAIVGSKTFTNYDYLVQSIKDNFNILEITEIISGGAEGADTLAERFAEENKIKITVFEAEWTKYGRPAGMIRNKDIIKNCDYVIAFWDGKSPGTKDSINLSIQKKKFCKIIYV